MLLFGWLSYRVTKRRRAWVIPLMILLGIAAWVLVYLSGIHPTIAGVALGLIMADASGDVMALDATTGSVAWRTHVASSLVAGVGTDGTTSAVLTLLSRQP